MQDEDIDKATTAGKKPPKRTLTAHEGLMFSSTNPTNKDILEHEQNIETFHKKIPVKVTRYNDAYYEKLKEKQLAKIKSFIAFIVILMIPLAAVKIFYSTNSKPLYEVKMSDEEEKEEKLKIKSKNTGLKAAMALAKQGSKINDNVEVVGDDDLFDQEGIVGLGKKKGKDDKGSSGTEDLPDSLKEFTGDVFSANEEKDEDEDKDQPNVIYLNRLFGFKKDGDKEKTPEEKNKEIAEKEAAEKEIENLKKLSSKESINFDDPFKLTKIEPFFENYPSLKSILEKTKSLDVEFLKQIVSLSKKGINEKLLNQKLETRFELESTISKKEAASLEKNDLKEWTANQVSYYKDLEKYLVDANALLDEEKLKYLKWMTIKERLDKNNLIQLVVNFSEKDEENSEIKKEFVTNWEEYRNMVYSEESTSKRLKQIALKEKIINEIGTTSTKIFLIMTILADSINFSEAEKAKLYLTFKFIDKNLSKNDSKEKLINGLESYRKNMERKLQEEEAKFSADEERSSLILKKLKSSK